MKLNKYLLGVSALIGAPLMAVAANNSPVGYWMQYSDNGKAQSIIQVYQGDNQQYEGKILVPFINEVNGKAQVPDVYCKACGKGQDNGYQYDYVNAPVQGLKIMWAFTKDSDGSGTDGALYDNGSLLDPSSGKVYSGKIQTQDNGNKLYVRGYIGLSLFGRTQYWYRIDDSKAKALVQKCGLTPQKTYPYADKDGNITNPDLWQYCSNLNLK